MKRLKQAGFSLIEILLYTSLVTILLLVTTDLLIGIGEFGLESSGKNLLQSEARFILNRITYDIRRSTAVLVPAAFGDTNQTNNLQLDLSLGYSPAESRSYTLTGSDLIYQRSDGISTQSARLNSNLTKLNSLWFTRVGTAAAKPTIKISLELETLRQLKSGPNKQIFETVVGKR